MAHYAVLLAFVLLPSSHGFWYPTPAGTSPVGGKSPCYPSPDYCPHTHPWKHVWAYKAAGDRCVREWTRLCGYGHTSSYECERECVNKGGGGGGGALCGHVRCSADEYCVKEYGVYGPRQPRCVKVAPVPVTTPAPVGPVCGHVRCALGERCVTVTEGWHTRLTCEREKCGWTVCRSDERCIVGVAYSFCQKLPTPEPAPVTTTRAHGVQCDWRTCRYGERCDRSGWYPRCVPSPTRATWPHANKEICGETYETDSGSVTGYVCSSIIKVVYDYDRRRCVTIGYCVDVSPSRNRFNSHAECKQACGQHIIYT